MPGVQDDGETHRAGAAFDVFLSDVSEVVMLQREWEANVREFLRMALGWILIRGHSRSFLCIRV